MAFGIGLPCVDLPTLIFRVYGAKMWNSNRRIAAACAVMASLTTAACHPKQQTAESVSKFIVTNPLRSDTELVKEYVAQIRAIQHIELRALERGYLQGVFVDEGKRVAKGTRLFQIMPLIYQAELQKAAAEANLAVIEFNNTKSLADQNIVAPNELAMATARADRARAEVDLASTHRSLTELKAPFDGLVGRFRVRTGSLLDEGDLLTTLADNSTMWVYFNVSESEYLAYKAKPQDDAPVMVKLMMANGQLYEHLGKIEVIEADFNNETGNIAFRAKFPNPQGLLRHGETGSVVMTLTLKNALLIPQKATFDVLDKKFVFVVDDKQVVHTRPIIVAAEKPQVFVIKSGLDEHDKILVEGLRKVSEGITIETDYQRATDTIGGLEVPAE